MRPRNLIAVMLVAATLMAQQPQTPPPPPAAPAQQAPAAQPGEPPIPENFGAPDFVEVVRRVVVPVTVRDRDGRYVTNLTPADFLLLDEGVPQVITEDIGTHPISLVVAVQANSKARLALQSIPKVAPMFDSLVIGETGEMAVLGFDHRIQDLTGGFTSDPVKIREGFNKLKPGSSQAHVNDATMHAVRMLQNRPRDRKKVVVLISETRDVGSAVEVRDVLTQAEFADVVIYPVSMNHFINQLTSQTEPNRPNPIPPEARLIGPMGTVSTITTDAQTNFGNYVPIFKEIFALVKGLFIPNAHEVYSTFTGGREQNFVGLSGLEEAVREIGADLHSQYMLTFSPSDKLASGYREIKVQVLTSPNLRVTTRPGYWIAPTPNN